MPQNFDIEIKNTNSKIVQEIENHTKTILSTLYLVF